MGYFRADEKLERGETTPPAPYSLRLSEVDETGLAVGLVWQRPTGRVEGYLVLVQRLEFRIQSSEARVAPQLEEAKTHHSTFNTQHSERWQTVLRVVGREKNAVWVRLAAEIWQYEGLELAVVAYCGEQLSPLSNRLSLPSRLRQPQVITVLPPTNNAQSNPEMVRPKAENSEPSVRTGSEESLTRQPTGSEANREAPQLAGWAEIEAALRQNSAALGRHGLFVRRGD